MATASKRRPTKADRAAAEVDRLRGEGRRAAFDGLGEEALPYGNPPFHNGYQFRERHHWLLGWWEGQDAMRAMSKEALARAVSGSPVAVAALEYARAASRITRGEHVEMATAARALIDAIEAEEG